MKIQDITDITEAPQLMRLIRPGQLRGSYTDTEMKKLGFKPDTNGWRISASDWSDVVGIEQGRLKKADVLARKGETQ
jgi:hypothetical protein